MRPSSREVLIKSHGWESFQENLSILTDKEKGDAFEALTKSYLSIDPVYASKFRHVWLLNEVPYSLRQHLNLPAQDMGIDLVAETHEGQYWAIQCKYREASSPIGWGEISTFIGLTFKVCKNFSFALICYTGNKYTKLIAGQPQIGFCSNETWRQLDKGFFQKVSHLLAGDVIERTPLVPRPHQKRAIDQVVQYFSSLSNSRGKLIMPCGTGKSLVSCWVARELRSRNILVIVPSLSLLRQTLEVWLQNYVALDGQKMSWICVCSDQTVGDIQRDEIISVSTDLGVPCTTEVSSIVNWFNETKDAVNRIVFTTYQSGKTVSDASTKAQVGYDLGVFDEAHKTTGSSEAQFSYLLHERNIKIERRLYMTATERRYEGNKDSIASMDNVSLYGETAYYLSFKEALNSEPQIIADYKILTLFVSRKEIAEIISSNSFVRPAYMAKSKWDDEVEAGMLACLVALRKAMQKFHISHAVSYHASIARAKAFQLNSDIFTNSYPRYGVLDSFHVTGMDSTGVRYRVLQDFSRSEKGLITNARCLTEGIDIPNIDCVLFADPRKSKVDIVQALGRALRPSTGKECGYILIPVIIDEGMTLDDVWETDAFKEMLFMIRALATNDERVIEYFRGVASGRARTSRSRFIEHFATNALITQAVNFDEFIESVNLYCWDNLTKLAYRSYSNAKSFVHELQLESEESWRMYCANELQGLDPKPNDIPEDPELVYKDVWEGWQKWLGGKPVRRYKKFPLARDFVRGLHINSEEKWNQYRDDKLKGYIPRPWYIPANPQVIYFADWVGWDDWLGINRRAVDSPLKPPSKIGKHLPFEIARDFVRSWRFENKKAWERFMQFSPNKAKFVKLKIPGNPQETYIDEWQGWDDWLGGPGFLPFEEARMFARSLKFKNKHEWDKYRNGELQAIPHKPETIPYSPALAYRKQWRGWRDWLYALEEQPVAFNVAKAYVRARRLKDFQEWIEYRDGRLSGKEPLPEIIPRFPDLVYLKEWVSWDDWLGRDFLTFEQARKRVRRRRLNNLGEWSAWVRGTLDGSGKKPANIPRHPEKVYKSAWRGWDDWLGIKAYVGANLRREQSKLSLNQRVMQKYMLKESSKDAPYLSFKAARGYIRAQQFQNIKEWRDYCEGRLPTRNKPANIPANPETVYADEWQGWIDWLVKPSGP